MEEWSQSPPGLGDCARPESVCTRVPTLLAIQQRRTVISVAVTAASTMTRMASTSLGHSRCCSATRFVIQKHMLSALLSLGTAPTAAPQPCEWHQPGTPTTTLGDATEEPATATYARTLSATNVLRRLLVLSIYNHIISMPALPSLYIYEYSYEYQIRVASSYWYV